MTTLEEKLTAAIQHHQAGRLHEAELLYREALAEHPTHPDALHLLGVLAYQSGHPDAAAQLIGQAIAARPGNPDYHCNMGLALAALGHFDEAVAEYRRCLGMDPLALEGYLNLGNALRKLNRHAEAISAYEQGLTLQPKHAASYTGMGHAFRALGRGAEAINAWRTALQLQPEDFEARFHLAETLRETGKFSAAVDEYRRVAPRQPSNMLLQQHLSDCLAATGHAQEAITLFLAAMVHWPNDYVAWNHAGFLYLVNEDLDSAIDAFRKAIAARSDHSSAHINLGHSLQSKGQLHDAIKSYERAMELSGDNSLAASNRLMALLMLEEYDAAALLREHREWDQRYATPLRHLIKPPPNDRSPDRKLRVGFVSPDFRNHVVGWNLLSLLEKRDRDQIEVIAYAASANADDLTRRLAALADGWRSISGADDDRAAEIVRNDKIDILVDLTMHSGGNRLQLFARKPAPVQLTYLGYAGTTGLRTIDYRLSDPFLDPDGTDLAVYSETTIRLPGCYWCYQPAGETPPIAPPPSSLLSPSPCTQGEGRGGASSDTPQSDPHKTATPRAFITFGCLNNFSKVSQQSIVLWSDLLKASKDSRLLLHCPSPAQRTPVLQQFTELGIAPARIEFVGRQSFFDYMQTYARIDIALDPFPYGGAITTCDALWMGVPVITLRGNTAVGRAATSILSNAGLPELSAATKDEYLRIALDLAADLPRLQSLRGELRGRLKNSPVMDAARFAADFQSALRKMWQSWCKA